MKVTPNILENLEYADIVRGSREDFEVMFRKTEPDVVYRSEIAFYTRKFIYTQGADPVELWAEGGLSKQYPVIETDTVSTIDAGASFNAGLVYGMIRYGITRDVIETGLTAAQWDDVIHCAQLFSANCCKGISNSIDKEFGKQMENEIKS